LYSFFTFFSFFFSFLSGTEADLINDAVRLRVIESDYYGTGKVPWNGALVLNHRWRNEGAKSTAESN